MKPKITRVLLTAIMLLLSFKLYAYDFEVDGIYYNIDGTNATVTYKSYNDAYYSGEVIIPTTVTYKNETYTVTSIGNSAFRECTGLTSITIPEGVTSIGNNAFEGCTGLTSITIPNSVTSMGEYAFYGCTELTSITIPEGVTSINYSAFRGCTGLTSITIPEGVTSIGSYAFFGCKGLTSITIPEGVTSIGYSAFWGCTELTSVTIPNSVTSIGSFAFRYCNIKKISVPILFVSSFDIKNIESITLIGSGSIANSLFSICTSLTSVILSDSITSIGDYAFQGCWRLTSVTISNSVISIGNYAFQGCTKLTSITIPNSVTSIGSYAFSECTGLTSITIPEGVTSIGYCAFYGCTGLTSITIPNSYTSIGYYAFSECTGLTSITIPNSVTSIGDYAFQGCTKLTSITIPNSVTSIGSYAFSKCTGLTSITIPNSVISIGDYAYNKCTALTSIEVNESNTNYSSNEGVLYNKNKTTLVCVPAGAPLTTYTIPSSVTVIKDGAFCDCTKLTSVIISENVKQLSDSLFYNCMKLDSVIIPNRVSSIGNSAFLGCSSLKSIIIPDAVTSIGDSAFYYCTNLNSVSPSKNISCIGSKAFYGTPWHNNLPDGLHYFGLVVYYSKGELSGNTIYIKEGTKGIAGGAFLDCKDLLYIHIPNSVTNIGDYAFGSSIIRIYCHCITPPSANSQSFYYIIKKECSVYLTSYNYVDNYKKANGWETIAYSNSYFSRIAQIDNLIYSLEKNEAEVIGCTSITDSTVTVPEKISYDSKEYIIANIYSYAFRNCSDLSSIIIPSSVTEISSSTFKDCTSLKNITAPYLKKEMFDYDDNYGRYVFPESLTSVTLNGNTEYCDFSNNTTIKTIEVLESATLTPGCLAGCAGLETLVLPYVGVGSAQTVSGKSGLLGSLFGTEEIGGMKAVTQYYSAEGSGSYYLPATLGTLIISDGCLELTYGALYGCSMLKKLVLPQSLFSVGEKALYGCAALTDIYCYGAEPSVAYDNSFTGVRKTSCKLHIPTNTKQLYSISDGWKDFFYMEEESPLMISVTKNIENGGVILGNNNYTMGETCLLTAYANTGYRFAGWMEDSIIISENASMSFMVMESHSLMALFVPVLNENEVMVEPIENQVNFTWTHEENAAHYILNIYSDAELTQLVASLTFDAEGSVVAATRSADEIMSYTVTGLDANMQFYYEISAYTTEEVKLSQKSGSFVTPLYDAITSLAADELQCSVSDGTITLSGACGKQITIASVNGKVMKRFAAVDQLTTIEMPKGIYVVVVGNDKKFKVAVK